MPPRPSEALARLGLTLPPPPRPVGSYAPVVVDGDRAWVSGQIVVRDGAAVPAGPVGDAVDVPTAQAAARTACLQALSLLAAALGDLDRIRRPIRLAAYVACAPGFARTHEVANGATDLLVALFGDEARPARVTIGVAALPLNASVEIELTVATG